MLSRIRSAQKALSIVGALLRQLGRRRTRAAGSSEPVVEVTLFRLVLVLPGARHDEGATR
jgi:hypothetical protein